MRWVIENAINKEEELLILKEYPTSSSHTLINKTNNPVILKILDVIKEKVDFEIKKESYFTVESRNLPHEWHCDTGSNNHMMWCSVGATILLSGNHVGGNLSYRNEDDSIDTIDNRKPYDLYFHESNVYHKVDESAGDRKVLLLFI